MKRKAEQAANRQKHDIERQKLRAAEAGQPAVGTFEDYVLARLPDNFDDLDQARRESIVRRLGNDWAEAPTIERMAPALQEFLANLPEDSFTINPFTEDEVRAICETTENVGKRLTAHAHSDSGVRQCMQYGVELINHATFASDATIEALAKVADKHWVTPAIAARYNTTYEAGAWGITTEVAESMGNKRELEAGCVNMQKMYRAGIRVLPFGDYGFARIPIGTDCRDLEHMINLFDMQPWEALRAAGKVEA